MLPILVQHLPRDRERMGLSEGHMAWLLGITRPQYRELEAGRLQIDNDLFERIIEVCGWPR
jgi:predicted transcriptional regulator